MTVRVDTLGWDIAACIPLSAANAALAGATRKLISGFDFMGDEDGLSYRLTGTFGAWSILGGSGELIDLALPIHSGTFDFAGITQDLNGVVVRVRTRLRFAEAPAQDGAGDGGAALVFGFDEQHPDGLTPKAAGVYAASLEPGHALGLEAAAVLPLAVAACLAHHMDQVRFVFATLVPHDTLQTRDAAGLAHCAYLAHCPAEGPGALVVLWAAPRDGDAAPPAPVVPEAIQNHSDCISVALSADMTLRQVLRQALALGLQRVQIQDAATHDVSIDQFDARIEQDGAGYLTARQPFELALEAAAGGRADMRVQAMSLESREGLVTLNYNVCFAKLPYVSHTVSQSYTVYVGHNILPGLRTPGLRLLATADNLQQGSAQRQYGLLEVLRNRDAMQDVFTRTVQLPEKLKHAFDRVPVPLGLTIFDDASISPDDGYLNAGVLFHCPVPAFSSSSSAEQP